jgi:flagellar hook-associated protein 1 FlgK
VTGAVPPVVGTVAYTSGQNISYNGWTVKITGTPVANDVFNIATNTNGTNDNRNALLMAGLQTQNLLANGTTTFEGAYGQLVGDVGAKTHELTVTSQAQNTMVTQTIASQQAVSGVNLDEEAANLLRYQNAYQAAAKAMQIASTLFDTLLAIGR